MNDYRRIRRRASGHHKYVRPSDLLALHRASRAWLDGHLAQPHAGPTVVVTHHAPHPASLPAPGFDLAHCYASDLSPLIEARQPDLWVHGHLHSRADYRIGATRIVCNPRGHIEEPGAATFDPSVIRYGVPTLIGVATPLHSLRMVGTSSLFTCQGRR